MLCGSVSERLCIRFSQCCACQAVKLAVPCKFCLFCQKNCFCLLETMSSWNKIQVWFVSTFLLSLTQTTPQVRSNWIVVCYVGFICGFVFLATKLWLCWEAESSGLLCLMPVYWQVYFQSRFKRSDVGSRWQLWGLCSELLAERVHDA